MARRSCRPRISSGMAAGNRPKKFWRPCLPPIRTSRTGCSFWAWSAKIRAGLAEAEQLLRRSLAARPKQPHVQVHLGRILAETGKHQEAIDLLQAAAQAQPDLFDAFVVLAQVQFTVGDLTAAEKNYRSALAACLLTLQVALLGLGVLLNQTRRPAEAETLLRAAAQNTARPPSWQAKIARSLGLSLDLQGKTEEALEAWQRAIALDPTNAEAHRELNALLYRLGRAQEFLASYDQAARSLPPSRAAERGALLLQKAGFLIDAERFAEARDCFAQLAKMAPQSAGPPEWPGGGLCGPGAARGIGRGLRKIPGLAAGRYGHESPPGLCFAASRRSKARAEPYRRSCAARGPGPGRAGGARTGIARQFRSARRAPGGL